ncbi:hypothetical protein DFS34DRAFT_591017 [Phlyctochytrium arcticum]|nr:hypothetical protein DFS34DRAFT_591383 [Phlyctochytrium arcticum]KAI9103490.1 hypothetical protein DFS34DRAFT_591017 [Phlyctochytrium arcticum]
MDYLEKKMERLIDLDQSPEFKSASKLIKEHTDLLATIKKTMKSKNITTWQIKRGTLVKKLKFKIQLSCRVDTSAMPEEVRDLYMTESEMWVKNVDIIDMGGDVIAGDTSTESS